MRGRRRNASLREYAGRMPSVGYPVLLEFDCGHTQKVRFSEVPTLERCVEMTQLGCLSCRGRQRPVQARPGQPHFGAPGEGLPATSSNWTLDSLMACETCGGGYFLAKAGSWGRGKDGEPVLLCPACAASRKTAQGWDPKTSAAPDHGEREFSR